MGRTVPEFEDPDIREIIYSKYRVIYRLRGDMLEITRIIHGSRILKL